MAYMPKDAQQAGGEARNLDFPASWSSAPQPRGHYPHGNRQLKSENWGQ